MDTYFGLWRGALVALILFFAAARGTDKELLTAYKTFVADPTLRESVRIGMRDGRSASLEQLCNRHIGGYIHGSEEKLFAALLWADLHDAFASTNCVESVAAIFKRYSHITYTGVWSRWLKKAFEELTRSYFDANRGRGLEPFLCFIDAVHNASGESLTLPWLSELAMSVLRYGLDEFDSSAKLKLVTASSKAGGVVREVLSQLRPSLNYQDYAVVCLLLKNGAQLPASKVKKYFVVACHNRDAVKFINCFLTYAKKLEGPEKEELLPFLSRCKRAIDLGEQLCKSARDGDMQRWRSLWQERERKYRIRGNAWASETEALRAKIREQERIERYGEAPIKYSSGQIDTEYVCYEECVDDGLIKCLALLLQKQESSVVLRAIQTIIPELKTEWYLRDRLFSLGAMAAVMLPTGNRAAVGELFQLINQVESSFSEWQKRSDYLNDGLRAALDEAVKRGNEVALASLLREGVKPSVSDSIESIRPYVHLAVQAWDNATIDLLGAIFAGKNTSLQGEFSKAVEEEQKKDQMERQASARVFYAGHSFGSPTPELLVSEFLVGKPSARGQMELVDEIRWQRWAKQICEGACKDDRDRVMALTREVGTAVPLFWQTLADCFRQQALRDPKGAACGAKTLLFAPAKDGLNVQLLNRYGIPRIALEDAARDADWDSIEKVLTRLSKEARNMAPNIGDTRAIMEKEIHKFGGEESPLAFPYVEMLSSLDKLLSSKPVAAKQ